MGFPAVLREDFVESVESDGQASVSSSSAMEDAKAMRHTEKLESVNQRQLEVQGEALQVVEKSYGIWQSLKMNKTALLYSTQSHSL
jgi:hypothetical protein